MRAVTERYLLIFSCREWLKCEWHYFGTWCSAIWLEETCVSGSTRLQKTQHGLYKQYTVYLGNKFHLVRVSYGRKQTCFVGSLIGSSLDGDEDVLECSIFD